VKRKRNERRNERTKDSKRDRKRAGGKGIKKGTRIKEARENGQGLKGRHNGRQRKKKIRRMKIQRAA